MTEGASSDDLSRNDQRAAGQGPETLVHERELSLLEGLEREMDEVQTALDRLEDGTYGRCEICREPIVAERLEQLPATRYCIDHQPRSETPLETAAKPEGSAE